MDEEPKRYTKQEFERILAKAGEMGAASGLVRPIQHGLTIDDMKSIASEAGFDPGLVARAARLVSDEARPSFLQRVLGGRLSDRKIFNIPGEFTEERAKQLLASARSTLQTHGDGDANASGVSWSAKAGRIFVSGHGHGADTRVQVAVDNRPAVVIPLTLLPAGIVATLYAAIAAGDSGFANPYLILAGGWGITAAWAWSAVRRITRKTRATLENLIDAIGSALDRERAS